MLRLRWRIFGIAAAISLHALNPCAWALLPCDQAFLPYQQVKQSLQNSARAEEIARKLEAATPQRLKYRFKVAGEDGTALPTDSSQYENAAWINLDEEPAPDHAGENLKRVENVSFGYPESTSSQTIGKLDYVLINSSGEIVELGAGSHKLLEEFHDHLAGKTFSPEQLKRVQRINAVIYERLSTDPRAAAEVRKFEQTRGWPDGLAKKLKLVYFDSAWLDLKGLARELRFTQSDFRNAGWLKLKFTRDGRRFFVPTYDRVIKIPFFEDAAESKIVSWRIRILNPEPGNPKYLSSPLDRALEERPPIQTRVYNSWKLSEARGKRVVITEGEFKSRVATETTGIIHLGIPGISEFDTETVKALQDAGVAEVIVILDRDPIAKRLIRVDEISDSERAAYLIAKQLEGAIPSVKVGTLPDVFEGGKVGIDDLILEKGADAYLPTIHDAVSADQYAIDHQIDPLLQTLIHRQRLLSRAIRQYGAAVARGNPSDIHLFGEAWDQLAAVEKSLRAYYQQVLHTGRSLGQPSVQYQFLPTVSALRTDILPQFRGDILLIDFKSDPGVIDHELPYSDADLMNAFAGDRPGGMERVIQKGEAMAQPSGFTPSTLSEFALIPLAGYLTSIYPPDDYRYGFQVRVGSQVLPIVIYKKDLQKVVAIAQIRQPGAASLLKRLQPVLRPGKSAP